MTIHGGANQMAHERKPLFDKPQGPSVRSYTQSRTVRGITCELCGTTHPELGENDKGYDFLTYNGYQIVEQCCGAFIDRIYDRFGEIFFANRLREFDKDPLSKEYGFKRICITIAVESWCVAAKNATEESDEVQAILPEVS